MNTNSSNRCGITLAGIVMQITLGAVFEKEKISVN